MRDTERELLDLLTGYLLKEKSIEDCAKWFAELEWSELPIIGNLELLAHGPESAFWEEAALTVAGLLQPTEEADE